MFHQHQVAGTGGRGISVTSPTADNHAWLTSGHLSSLSTLSLDGAKTKKLQLPKRKCTCRKWFSKRARGIDLLFMWRGGGMKKAKIQTLSQMDMDDGDENDDYICYEHAENIDYANNGHTQSGRFVVRNSWQQKRYSKFSEPSATVVSFKHRSHKLKLTSWYAG